MKDLYKQQKDFFISAYGGDETPWPNIEPTHEIRQFLSRIRREGGSGRVLDLGCGEGRHSFLFQDEGFQVWGVDYVPLAVQKAKLRGRARRGAGKGEPFFLAGDLFSLPFSSDVFDIVLDYGCLHHVRKRDFDDYLEIILDLLKPRGYYLLSCFSTEFRHYPGEKRSRNWLVHHGHYDRFFEKTEFRRLFGRQFDILEIRKEKKGLSSLFHVMTRKK